MIRLRTAFLVWLACLLPLQAAASTLQWTCAVRHGGFAAPADPGAAHGHGAPHDHAAHTSTSGEHGADAHAASDHEPGLAGSGADGASEACGVCGWCGVTAGAVPAPWRLPLPTVAGDPAGPRATPPPSVEPTRLDRPPRPAQA